MIVNNNIIKTINFSAKENNTDKSRSRATGGIVGGFAGGIAGGFARIFVAPFDLIEIRWQVQNHRVNPIDVLRNLFMPSTLEKNIDGSKKYTSLFQSITRVVREEGFFALWKGNMSAQIMTMLYGATQFGAYGFVKPLIKQSCPNNPMAIEHWSTITSLGAGSFAGICATLSSYPFDLMRTRLAAQQEPKTYKSMPHGFKTVFATSGIRGLYAGLWPTLVLIIPYTSIAFCSFDYLKAQIQIYNSTIRDRALIVRTDPLTSSEALICGFSAGLIAKFSTYPLDVCKKRFQVGGFKFNSTAHTPMKYRGVLHCLYTIYTTEGIFALYKGTFPSLLKSAPNSALSFMIFEWVKAFF